MSTDREKIKAQQEGEFLGAAAASAGAIAGMSDAKAAVKAMHCRPYTIRKAGTENAETNVAETPFGTVFHKSRARKFGIQTAANVASDNTDYIVLKFYKRVAGTSTLIGSWNTHGGAQGALTTAGPAVIATAAGGLVVNSDADIAENSGLTYVLTKVAAGKDLPAGSIFSAWLEEI